MAAPNTTVSFTFDDGRPSQIAAAQQLSNRGMKATFFIISSTVGQDGVMSLSDLNALKAGGNEIAAHTVFHRDLQNLSSDEAKRELCLSRNWLMDRGFDVYDMAYPYDSTNAAVKQLVAACGYNGARSGGQLQCDANHACSETVPPLDTYSIRTPNALETTTTLADMKAMVTNAENSGGGWVPLEIHDICDGPGDPLLPAGAPCYAPGMVNRALFNQFLDWVKGEVDAGRVQVKTVHEVVGGALQPQVPMAPAPVRTGNELLNPSFEQSGTGTTPADCWGNINNGPDHPPVITSTNDAHEGSKALAIAVPTTYDSWAYNMIAPVLDLAQCSPTAVPGHDYTFSGWYKGNGQIKIVAYWRNADNFWQRISWGPGGSATFPAAANWTNATFSFAAPAGATAVSAGFYVDGTSVIQMGGNTYTIDDMSLVDDDAAPLANYALNVSSAGAGSGTVTSNPAGIDCGATCSTTFTDGTSVTLTAAAAAGSSFTGWSGACTGAATTCTVAMSQARSATATFALLPVQLSVATAGAGAGSVTSPAGIDCGSTCQVTVANGTSVTLTAAPAAGSSFTGWSGACTGAATTCTVAMNAAKSVTATFALLPVQLTVATSGTGAGSVTSPAGIDCGSTCQVTVANGTSVTLTAAAAVGSTFTGWNGACTGASATCVVSMNAAKSVGATFTILTYDLTVAKAGTGSGTVTSSPAGIDCGATCQVTLAHGTNVTLTAVPAAGSSFTRWNGACSTTSTTCTIPMSAAKSVTATFAAQTFHLTVAKAGTGNGSVSSSPAGIACGATCENDFANGATVTLTAAAAAGSSFTGWSGSCTGASTTCTVSMSAARSVTATFTLLPNHLTVAKAGTGNGSVSSSPAGIACGATCENDFTNGASVTLTAVAAAGSSFTGWSGACSGSSATCTVTLDVARSVTATFTLLPNHLTVAKTGTGTGSVTSSPAGIDCGATCENDFTNGASVTLTAVAAAGSSFTGWSGACTNATTTCTVSMSAARSVTATFTLLPLHLTVTKAGTGSGTVTSGPVGIACGVTCDADFTNGATVTLTAVAAAGSSFIGWSGACTNASPTCTVTVDQARAVTATFTLLPVHLNVTKSGTGTGFVTSVPNGIACGTFCQGDFTNGAAVTLTAVPAAGSTFTGWSGACSGTATTCTVTLDVARTVTAQFTEIPAPDPVVSEAPVQAPVPVVVPEPVVESPPVVRAPAAPVAPVAAAVAKVPTLVARPKISGKARVGGKLTCGRGTWDGSPTRYTFTWRSNGKVVGHASTYTAKKSDRGHSIQCSVMAANANGASTMPSAAVRVAK